MNKLRVLLVAAALLTAACGTATLSGSQVRSISNSGNLRVGAAAGANAATDVAADAVDAPRNPTVHKTPQPGPVQQSVPQTTNGTAPSTTVPDRCLDGGGSTKVGSSAEGFGKQPPMPACMPE